MKAILIHRTRDMIRDSLQFFLGIPHSDADRAIVEHLQVIQAVSDRDRPFFGEAKVCQQRFDCSRFVYAWYHQFAAFIPKLRHGALDRVKGVFEFLLDLCERKFVALKEASLIDVSLIQILFPVDQSLDEGMRMSLPCVCGHPDRCRYHRKCSVPHAAGNSCWRTDRRLTPSKSQRYADQRNPPSV